MENKIDKFAEDFLSKLGNIIEEQRRILDIKVADLSKKSGVSIGVISDLINNRGRMPSLLNFIKIANALELSDDIILGIFKGQDNSVENKKLSRNEMRVALNNYGLPKGYANNMLIQIDALLAHHAMIKQRQEDKNATS